MAEEYLGHRPDILKISISLVINIYVYNLFDNEHVERHVFLLYMYMYTCIINKQILDLHVHVHL